MSRRQFYTHDFKSILTDYNEVFIHFRFVSWYRDRDLLQNPRRFVPNVCQQKKKKANYGPVV